MNKNILLPLLAAIITLTACSGAEFVDLKKGTLKETQVVKKELSKILQNSNPRFLDRVLDNMQLPENLFNHISSDDKIIVQSVDRNFISDDDLQFVVYRGLVDKLLKKHLTVLDRDDNILAASLAESDNQFQKSWLVYKSKYADSLISFNNSKISRATKILGYRILEFGQSLVPIDEYNIQRVGNIELELRLVDAITTQIYYIDQIHNIYKDLIPKEDYQIIADLHYEFVSDALPLVKKVQYKNIIMPVDEEKTIYGDEGIEIIFRTGSISSYVTIIHNKTSKIVANFKVPSNSPGSLYTYTLKLTDENNVPLPKGNYTIFIDNYAVYNFEL